MNRRRQVRPRRISRSPFAHLWPELTHMPPLDHWPDRPKPFNPERSEVLAYMAEGFGCDLHVAAKIFEAARSKQVIAYNPETRLWCGVKGGQS